MNIIEVNKKQLDLLISLAEGKKILYNLSNEDSFTITMNDNLAEALSEKIQDQYVFEGFDINYNTTQKGKLFESIMDIFYKIGY